MILPTSFQLSSILKVKVPEWEVEIREFKARLGIKKKNDEKVKAFRHPPS